MLPHPTNLEYLHQELDRLNVLLDQAVQQFRSLRTQDSTADFRAVYISDDEIDRLIAPEAFPASGWTEYPTRALQLQELSQQQIKASRAAGVVLRSPYLCHVFRLSPFEADLILLGLAPELDLRYQRLYAYLQDDVTRKRPSIELALRLFCCSQVEQVQAREAFSSSSPLFNHSLLSLHEDPTDRPSPLLSHMLKLDDRIRDFLLGRDRLDSRLIEPVPLVSWLKPQQTLQELVLPAEVKQTLQQLICVQHRQTWLCLLQGSEGTGKQSCAEAVAQARKRSLLVVNLPAMTQADLPFHTLFSLALREARLYQALVYLDNWHELLADQSKYRSAIQFVEQSLESFAGIVFLASHTPWQPSIATRQFFVRLELPLPDGRSRRLLWQKILSQTPHVSAQVNIGELASAFRFSGGQIQRSIAQAKNQAQLSQGTDYQMTTADLRTACQLESSRRLISYARKIIPKRLWQDLVLPKDTLAQLQELCQQVRYRSQVYHDWGFEQRLSLGKGTIALFTGESGTGKTLSAEVLAKELELELYQVDLAQVVSKYIGETEKNLNRLFEDAQSSNAILFFDEADALFGKRSEIKDAHDRYANIEINYLLQRVETYEGVILLTSNLSKNIDSAFLRRLHFSIEFPFPDEHHRLLIWRRMFPAQAPLAADVDFEFLARKFKIAGGNIKNVAIAAAFRAAEADSEIHMAHLILSLKREYRKLGRICDRTEFESYYDLVR